MAKAKTVRVRVLAPFMVPHLQASAGDVMTMAGSDAKDLEAGGAVEITDDPTGTFKVASSGPKPDPLPVGSGPYEAPEGAKEQLDAGEGGNTPPAEQLPVGSGPYEPPPSAKALSEGKVPEEVGEAPTTEAKDAPDTHGPPEDEPKPKAATKKATKK